MSFNGNAKQLAVTVHADGSGIVNAQGAVVVAAGAYGAFLASLKGIVTSFDAGLQAAATAGKAVF